MSTDRNVKLPSEIWSRISEAAHAQGKSVDVLLEEAALHLLQVRDLRSFVSQNRELAQQKSLTEADIPRLIAETHAVPSDSSVTRCDL